MCLTTKLESAAHNRGETNQSRDQKVEASTMSAASASTKKKKHRRQASCIGSGEIEREGREDNKTPPLVTFKEYANMQVDKKRSPVSAVNFPIEQMKIPYDDEEHEYQSFTHTRRHDLGQSKSYEEQEAAKKEISPTKPPLRPKPDRVFRRSATDPDSLNVGQSEEGMMRFAEAVLLKGDAATAEGLFVSQLKLLEKKYGPNHRQVARCYHKIGEAWLLSGETELAVAHFEEAISIGSNVLGPHHLDVARSLEKSAEAKLQLNSIEASHEEFRRALRIKRSNLGLYHQEVAHLQTQLAVIYFNCDELMSAQASFEEALDAYQHLSLRDPCWTVRVAQALCSIGSIKLAQKKYSKAISFFGEASVVRFYIVIDMLTSFMEP